MRKVLLLGVTAALAVTATAWATWSPQRAAASLPTMNIAAIHASVDTSALPIAPVADYHVD